MAKDKYDALKLENQLCFPLYATAKEVVKLYGPHLQKLGLTYTQYLAMMVMWEHEKLSVKELGGYLYLDSGTLTPVLKALEKKGYITRTRSQEDERVLVCELTEEGLALRDEALSVPSHVGKCITLEPEEAMTLYKLLYKILLSDRD